MSNLRYLNLSYAGFSGIVPRQLGYLINLRALDLSSYGFGLTVEDFNWVTGLTSLRYLDMSGVNFTKASNSVHALNMLPSLSVLHLSSCELSQDMVFSANLSSIQELDISDNFGLHNSHLAFLQNMTALRILDISNCGLSFPLPTWVHKFKNLTRLNVGFNAFNVTEDGMLSILSRLCSLKSLDISQNTFLNQSLPFEENLSGCGEYGLEFLNLADTKLTGKFPGFISKLGKLKHLDLSGNSLHGSIPTRMDNFPLLELLDLSDNQFNGVIPYSVGKLSNIVRFDVSNNSLQGKVYDHIHLSGLSKLKVFSTSFNNLLIFVFKPDWIAPFQLEGLNMGSCKVLKFPQWLAAQTKLRALDLSNASISDSFPKWIQNFHLDSLDLSHNHITGPLLRNVGDIFPAAKNLYISNNLINGTIPSSICQMETLSVLDLSKNMLSGDIPDCLGDVNLYGLNLASNNLTGIIPNSIRSIYLQTLQLNNNSLEGELPLSLRNCTRLMLLNLGENRLSGNLPSWIGGSLSSLQHLRLRRNMFGRHIPQEICQLSLLSFLDLADNKLDGRIPRCLGNLTSMYSKIDVIDGYLDALDEVNVEVVIKGKEYTYTKTFKLLVNMDLSHNNISGIIPEEITNLAGLNGLNLSHNRLTGNIPKSIGKLESLESLDFSENKLSGNIPKSISDLRWLSYLNLAHNDLSGRIPKGRQLQTLNKDTYAENPKLCGEPLEKRCPGDQAAPTPSSSSSSSSSNEEDQENTQDKIWLYSFVTLGYATGLWGFVGVLMFKKSWRIAFFRFAEKMINWIHE